MTTPDEALKILRDAELSNTDIYELLGRLTVLAPDALVEGINNLHRDRSSKN